MRMKNNYYLPKVLIFLMTLFLISCKKEKTKEPEPETRLFTSMIINKYSSWYGNPSWHDNLISEFYKNQSEFDNYFSTPYEMTGKKNYLPDGSLLDPTLEGNNNLYRESLEYDSIKPGTYYLKIFNAYNHEKFVEFNKPYSFTISKPLDSITIFNTVIERYYINAFVINEMEINLGGNGNSYDPNAKVSVKFWKFYPSSYAGPPPTTFFEDSVLVRDFPYRKKPLSVTISEFNSWWTDPSFFVEISGNDIYQQHEVRIFDLLNLNKRLSDSLICFGSNQDIKYKLYGKWQLK